MFMCHNYRDVVKSQILWIFFPWMWEVHNRQLDRCYWPSITLQYRPKHTPILIILGMACPMIILKLLSKFQTPIFILNFLMSNGCHNLTHTHTHTQNFFGYIDVDTRSLSQLLVPAVKTWPRICHTLEFSNKIMWCYWWKETLFSFYTVHSEYMPLIIAICSSCFVDWCWWS